MIEKQTIGDELYVWIWGNGKRDLLYKRWISKGYGMVMDRMPFTSKDVVGTQNIINLFK